MMVAVVVMAGLLPIGCGDGEEPGEGGGAGGSRPARPVETPRSGPATRAGVPGPPDPATVAEVKAAIARMDGPGSSEIKAMAVRVRAAGERERAAILATLIRHYDGEGTPAVRQACLLCLLPFGPEAAAVMQRALRSDSDRGVREMAAYVLGEVGGEAQIDELFQAVLDDEPDVARPRRIAAAAIAAIGVIGGPKAAEVLHRIWKLDRMALGCRGRLLVAMGHAGDAAAIPLLAEVLGGQDALLRPSAVTGLGAMVARRPHDAAIRGAVMPLLRGRLDDADANVRARVARRLGWIGERTDVRRLEPLLEDAHKITTTIRMGSEVKQRDVYPVREEARKAIDAIRARLGDDGGTP